MWFKNVLNAAQTYKLKLLGGAEEKIKRERRKRNRQGKRGKDKKREKQIMTLKMNSTAVHKFYMAQIFSTS